MTLTFTPEEFDKFILASSLVLIEVAGVDKLLNIHLVECN